LIESLFQSVSDWSKDLAGAEAKSKQYIPGWHLHELTENDDWLYVKKLEFFSLSSIPKKGIETKRRLPRL